MTAKPARRWPRRVLTLLAAAVASLVIVDVAFRVGGALFGETPNITLDDRMGWRATPDYAFDGEKHDASGHAYRAHVTTDARGFRAYGEPSSTRPKVLVIGDSFTHAVDVSDDKTYFAVLGREAGLEVFAYGVGGFGTLQEWMALDGFVREIAPDVVLLQFSTNDFFNNSLEVESECAENNGKRKPYLQEDGSILYALPKPLAGLRTFSNEYWRLGRRLFAEYDRIRAAHSTGIEADIVREGTANAAFRRSVAVTERLLDRIVATSRPAPVLAFCVGPEPPCRSEFARIAPLHGIEVVPGVQDAIVAARAEGREPFAGDGAHWDDLGHAICARVLVDHLRTHPVRKIGAAAASGR